MGNRPPAASRWETDSPAASRWETDPPAASRWETDPPAASGGETASPVASRWEADLTLFLGGQQNPLQIFNELQHIQLERDHTCSYTRYLSFNIRITVTVP